MAYVSYEEIISRLADDKLLGPFAKVLEENKKASLESGDRPNLAQVEFDALVSRIFKILEDAVKKIEMALVLPSLLAKDKDYLSRYMPATQRLRLSDYCEKYLQERRNIDPKNPKETFMDQHLVKVLETVYTNKRIRDAVPTLLENLPPQAMKFLDVIKDIKSIAEIRLRTTASKELAREKVLHRVHCENEKEKVKIEDAMSTIKEREAIQYWQVARRNNNINIYKKELNDKKWKSNILIQKEIAKANKRMVTIYNESEERKALLKEKVTKAKQEYEDSLANSMELDKKLRDKKRRILNQLHSSIKKYDNDVSEKTEEVKKLSEELARQTKILDEFMVDFERQEKEYFYVIHLKEAEEKQAQQEKMLIFMMNRAAKTIQMAWRRYLQKKKKKGKGKGKGKKAKK